MSLALHDYLPEDMTDGEFAAILSATRAGWIKPPVYCSLRPEVPREYRSAHMRYLERRGLIRRWYLRADGIRCIQLNDQGLRLRLDLASSDAAELERRFAA